jgi:hypothetical protein
MKNVLNSKATESQEATTETNVDTSSPTSSGDINTAQCSQAKKPLSKLARCRARKEQPPVNNPDKLPVLKTQLNQVMAAFSETEDLVCLVIVEKKEGYSTEKVYPVTDELYENVKHEKALQSVTFFMAQALTGEISFTYCKNGPLGTRPCTWFISKKTCLNEATEAWLSISSNQDEGIYESTIADEQPELPTGGPEFYEALELALEDDIIDSLDHPILVANNIGQPKRSSKQSTTRRTRRPLSTNKEQINE